MFADTIIRMYQELKTKKVLLLGMIINSLKYKHFQTVNKKSNILLHTVKQQINVLS